MRTGTMNEQQINNRVGSALSASVGAPMGPPETGASDSATDFDFPQREAAFFYGLFLRGHDANQLRNDIRVPDAVLAKWTRDMERSPDQRAHFDRVLQFRRDVLAIFDSLIRNASPRIQ